MTDDKDISQHTPADSTMPLAQRVRLFRERFAFRDDVWGRYWTNKETGRSGYAPACQNAFKDGCGIGSANKAPCATCNLKEHRPVTDDVIEGHILGRHRIILYPLFSDGTTRVGACDLDCKPDRENKGYTWDDVSRLLALFRAWSLPYAAARSTTFGYHIYFLFSQPYSAARIRAVIMEAFEVVGFMEMMRRGERPVPETFPKQTYPTQVGNGLRPPLVMPGFVKERNGFIDDNNVFLPPEGQWAFLSNIPIASAEDFDRIIAERKIEVRETKFAATRSDSRKPSNATGSQGDMGATHPIAKLDQVFRGCAALRRVAERGKESVVGHNDGLGLLSILSRFKGWRPWLRTNLQGWDTTPQYQAEIDQAVATYSPYTCRKLQDWGVCPHRNPQHCLPAQPDETGKPVDPSPIRFATQKINWGDVARAVVEKGDS